MTLPKRAILCVTSTLLSDFKHLTLSQRFAEVVAADPEIGPEEPMPIDCLNAFKSLWTDAGVQLAIKKGNEYALHDNLT